MLHHTKPRAMHTPTAHSAPCIRMAASKAARSRPQDASPPATPCTATAHLRVHLCLVGQQACQVVHRHVVAVLEAELGCLAAGLLHQRPRVACEGGQAGVQCHRFSRLPGHEGGAAQALQQGFRRSFLPAQRRAHPAPRCDPAPHLPCIPVASMPICLVMLCIWVTLDGSVSLSGTLCCGMVQPGTAGWLQRASRWHTASPAHAPR